MNVQMQRAISKAFFDAIEQLGYELKTADNTQSDKYEITEVDYFENDAILVVDDKSYYFQFTNKPTLEEALVSLFMKDRIQFK